MPQGDRVSLWNSLSAAGRLSGRVLSGTDASFSLDDLERGTILDGRPDDLRGRSVLLSTDDQLLAALALIELDGLARRIVLCVPDLAPEYVPHVIATAEIDAIVSDGADDTAGALGTKALFRCGLGISRADFARNENLRTEWVLLTSGTTGPPKMVVHTLASLTGAIKDGTVHAAPPLWSTFYDIRRYGGLQVLLRALLGGGSMVLSSARESTGDFLARAGARGVTHILGTPTHWRNTLMSPSARCLGPQYVRLSGEIADQTILNQLRTFFPQARVVHAFASTEAGVAMEVADGLAGFPAGLVGQPGAEVEMKVEQGSLRIRSARTAARYLGTRDGILADEDGYVDTGDMVELHGDRYHYVGRRGGIINIGGLKVHPEEVESVINTHPKVRISLVRARKSPITGALVTADVVLSPEFLAAHSRDRELEHEILEFCRAVLPRHKVPAMINFVPSLAVSASGKIGRPHA